MHMRHSFTPHSLQPDLLQGFKGWQEDVGGDQFYWDVRVRGRRPGRFRPVPRPLAAWLARLCIRNEVAYQQYYTANAGPSGRDPRGPRTRPDA